MRVGVNLLWLVPGVVGGSEEVTTALLLGLAEAAPADEDVTLFVLPSFVDAHPELTGRFRTVPVCLDGRHKPLRVVAEATWLAAQGRRRRIDVMFHAGGTVPIGDRFARSATVLLVHDVQPLVLPDNFSLVKRTYLRAMLPRSLRAADVVLARSEHVRQTIAEAMPRAASASLVRTLPPAVQPQEPVTDVERAAVRDRYLLSGPFFLYPAITYPHKNHTMLACAFAGVVASHPEATLVLTGRADSAERTLADAVDRFGVAEHVRRLGRVPSRDLAALYAEATALTFPSRYEGYGNPVAEAMASGCPVIAADATSLPEVVDDAGWLVAPDEPKEWTEAMRRLLDDETARRELADRGRARAAATFGAEHAAAALLDALREAVAHQ